MDLFSLKGKNIAITGASSGFGHHFAGVLAGAGANVILGARRAEKIADRVSEINQSGGRALGIPLDVTIPDSCAEFLHQSEEAFGTVDVLINNAGVEAGAKTYAMIDEDDWDFVLDTNLKSVWRLSKMYTESVVKNKQSEGNIINVASITAYRTIKGQFPYAVSKAALVKATEIMALEGARYGIRVNSLAPGYILTDVSRILLESERSDSFVKGIPMRRYGEFEDLDGPLLLLASDGSRYMTGSTVVVDGGHIVSEL
ncbi:MAG: SDR family oxidoreductase [Gammaproteobacteria bacterium]|nr:SDR family oxidoreductase [Gammaproteobacteria bacterium]MBT5154719.1 SDR family oxidoreductase [Gammaproteobacteria bacterium]MBT5686503.1 SDR family oxidoreductase [Gammaproteobacteria bacterium]MBT6584466.1 SDR family oxidoreductase [Gammaproteobacteria bacterium]MBT6892822.1 SDR family oxidoreductase [Gammaproteobacteria bacterium]